MSDEKKGAVLTSEERFRAELARWKEHNSPGVGKLGLFAKDSEWDAVLSAIEKARLAAELFEQHGEDILNALRFASDAPRPGARKAFESTIAAFRKGAE
jgi:hypothetical protein